MVTGGLFRKFSPASEISAVVLPTCIPCIFGFSAVTAE